MSPLHFVLRDVATQAPNRQASETRSHPAERRTCASSRRSATSTICRDEDQLREVRQARRNPADRAIQSAAVPGRSPARQFTRVPPNLAKLRPNVSDCRAHAIPRTRPCCAHERADLRLKRTRRCGGQGVANSNLASPTKPIHPVRPSRACIQPTFLLPDNAERRLLQTSYGLSPVAWWAFEGSSMPSRCTSASRLRAKCTRQRWWLAPCRMRRAATRPL
jgi:hypothetical protein